jgi:hypothetical protein
VHRACSECRNVIYVVMGALFWQVSFDSTFTGVNVCSCSVLNVLLFSSVIVIVFGFSTSVTDVL